MGDRQPWSAFEYFSVYRMSVLGVGDAQKRDVGGVGRGDCGEFFIIKKRKNRAGARCPMGSGLDAAI